MAPRPITTSMEGTDVKFLAQRLAGSFAQFQDFHCADFVTQRLARVDEIAFHFGDDIAF